LRLPRGRSVAGSLGRSVRSSWKEAMLSASRVEGEVHRAARHRSELEGAGEGLDPAAKRAAVGVDEEQALAS
jgi:hypothetical protein